MKEFFRIWRQASFGLLFLISIGCLAVGCASTKQEESSKQPSNGNVANSNGEAFAIGDLVVVSFSNTVDQIPPHEERIKEDGNITLPLIGTIKAEGKTPRELLEEIQDLYGPRSYRPKRLAITLSGDKIYFVGGQVRQPGPQVCSGRMTVTKAIQNAGGFTDFALRSGVQLTRGDGKTLVIDCIRAERSPAIDLPVYPGDRILVPMRGPKSDM